MSELDNISIDYDTRTEIKLLAEVLEILRRIEEKLNEISE